MAKKKEVLTLEERLEKALVPKDEIPYDVPENWVWTRLDNAFENVTSSTKKLKQKDYLLNGEIIVVDQGKEFIGGYSDKYEFVYNKDLPVILFGDHTRVIKYIDFPFIQGADGVKLLKPKPFWNKRCFYYALQNVDIKNLGYRRHFKIFSKLSLCLPPLPEQNRIVERIERLFSKLDDAKELVQNAIDSFENRKSAILHKALTGELTQKWREENGISLDSWNTVTFQKFCYLNRGFDLPSKNRNKGDYSLVTSSGITDTHNEYKIKAPGVVTGRSGTIGKVFYIENDYWPLNTTLYAKEMYDNYPKYVYYYLINFDFKKYSSSTAVPTLNRNNFSDELITVPIFFEQQEIVRILDSIFEKESNAKELYSIIDQIDLMKKSILARAFRGELGTNDPNDESAIELLKSIIETENQAENKPSNTTKPKQKRVFIPKEIKQLLHTAFEEKIYKIILKNTDTSMDTIFDNVPKTKQTEAIQTVDLLLEKELITLIDGVYNVK